jgi:hypothetical protein
MKLEDTVVANPNLLCPGFKVESNLLGDLIRSIRRGKDFEPVNAVFSAVSQGTSMALTPSEVESGHSVTTRQANADTPHADPPLPPPTRFSLNSSPADRPKRSGLVDLDSSACDCAVKRLKA